MGGLTYLQRCEDIIFAINQLESKIACYVQEEK